MAKVCFFELSEQVEMPGLEGNDNKVQTDDDDDPSDTPSGKKRPTLTIVK